MMFGLFGVGLLFPGRWVDVGTQVLIEVLENNLVTLCTEVPQPWRQFLNFTEGDGVVFLGGAVGRRGKIVPPSIIWNGSFSSEWEKLYE